MVARLTVRGLSRRRSELEVIARRAKDFRPAMEAGGDAMMTFIDDRFRSETAPSGESWPDFDPATLRQRRQGNPKLLTKTGRLRNSRNYDATPKTLRWGMSASYALPHQTGGEDLPQRAFAPVEKTGGTWRAIQSGPAGRLWDRITDGIIRYIKTGRVG